MNVALLLSGGVDSSVALHLLKQQGHDVTAFYLKIWLEDELSFLGDCPWEDDLSYARAVCEAAGVPLEVISMQRQYHEQVVHWAIEELSHGRTPSPDILCNRRVKFGVFLNHLEQQYGDRFQKVASGHYARLRESKGRVQLLKGVDAVKDQTYFLFRLDQAQLARCLFPVGEYTKDDIRHLANQLQLANRDRKDSQGICFLGKIRFDDFVASYLGENPGEIRDVDSGRRLGQHRGLWFHTIGQRKGLGLHGGPWYVVRKDMERNIVFVAHKEAHASHRRDAFRLVQPHWIDRVPEPDSAIQVRIRHTPAVTPARLRQAPGGLEVHLGDADPGIADGQSAVIYDGDVCLGGGTIATLGEAGSEIHLIEHPVDHHAGDRHVEPDR